jgi:hypothetical protein
VHQSINYKTKKQSHLAIDPKAVWQVEFDYAVIVLKESLKDYDIFWSHASQRDECRDFGNVVTFDTMDKTNKHRMSLAIFVGLNHYLLNVVFGQLLLRDASSDSFELLFIIFKACMGGRKPHVLLTGKCWFFLHITSAYPGLCNTL